MNIKIIIGQRLRRMTMLEKIDLTKKMGKQEYKERMVELELKLAKLQRECKELRIPVMIVFEGFGASGKGLQIGKLIHALDPRGFEVFAVKRESEEEIMRPFLWRFWTKTPERGRIAIYDTSWYRKVLIDRFDKKTSAQELVTAYDEINSFEQQLTEDGNVIIKLFLNIDKKTQTKRFKGLLQSKGTAWRVSIDDLKRNVKFEKYKIMNEEMIIKTDTDNAPWNIIEAKNRRFATVKIYTTVIQYLSEKIKEITQKKEIQHFEASDFKPVDFKLDKQLEGSILSGVDLSLTYTREEYKDKLKVLQNKMKILHGELYRRRISAVICFEGWDAAGKGGAIKRLTEKMDPRGYVVNTTASPNDYEKAHHYLWRFWRGIPKAGHVAVYDRTWYGKVMVERIEGYCTTKEWQRAYKEINEMEEHLVNDGVIVMKFWMQIDKNEQEKRFNERVINPDKEWKITEEDWRNREKWDMYEEAVNEMLIRTSTVSAPWTVVESNCKYYARIKVLESVVAAIEKRLE